MPEDFAEWAQLAAGWKCAAGSEAAAAADSLRYAMRCNPDDRALWLKPTAAAAGEVSPTVVALVLALDVMAADAVAAAVVAAVTIDAVVAVVAAVAAVAAALVVVAAVVVVAAAVIVAAAAAAAAAVAVVVVVVASAVGSSDAARQQLVQLPWISPEQQQSFVTPPKLQLLVQLPVASGQLPDKACH